MVAVSGGDVFLDTQLAGSVHGSVHSHQHGTGADHIPASEACLTNDSGLPVPLPAVQWVRGPWHNKAPPEIGAHSAVAEGPSAGVEMGVDFFSFNLDYC